MGEQLGRTPCKPPMTLPLEVGDAEPRFGSQSRTEADHRRAGNDGCVELSLRSSMFSFAAPGPFVVACVVSRALTGLFGVGGSSIATPLLAVLGVPGLLAVASPLPGRSRQRSELPGRTSGTGRPGRERRVDAPAPCRPHRGRVAVGCGRRPNSLIASGVVLVIVGQRVLQPIERSARRAGRSGGRTVSCWWPPRGCRAVHRPARQRWRLPPRADVPVRLRTDHA